MALVVYKCGVCQREVEIPQNKKGIEVTGRCIITDKCRGTLTQKEVLIDYTRGKRPDPVVGLDDWNQRKLLYNHQQSIENEKWEVVHNLGASPTVSTFVETKGYGNEVSIREVLPDNIDILSPNALTIYFDKAYSGMAQLVTRTSLADSKEITTIGAIDAIVPKPVPFQCSNEYEITIATSIQKFYGVTNIELTLVYKDVSGNDIEHTFTIDDQPSINSPWNSVERVLIKGKMYTVRSFRGLLSPEMNDGIIASGSAVKFTKVSSGCASGSPCGIIPDYDDARRDIEDNEIYMLLANDPYTNVDIITDKMVDVNDTNHIETNMFFDRGEYYVNDTIIQQTYPPIRSIYNS